MPAEFLPQDEKLQMLIIDTFSAPAQLVQQFRDELAVFFHHDSARPSVFTELRLNDLVEHRKSATIDTLFDSINNIPSEGCALMILKHYGSSSLSGESFYTELLRNPHLLIAYTQSLDFPVSVTLGIIQATTAIDTLIKPFMRFLRAYRAAFENAYSQFREWLESRAAELESVLSEQFDEVFHRLSPEIYSREKTILGLQPWQQHTVHDADRIQTVYYCSMLFRSSDAADAVVDDSAFISIGAELPVLNKAPKAEQLEATKAFKYLDEPKHVAILRSLSGGELCVSDIREIIKKDYSIPQPTLSGYLQDLYEMGAVKRHYDGVKCYYEIDPEYIIKGKAFFDTLGQLLMEHGKR